MFYGVTVSDWVREIAEEAFSGCKGIKNLSLLKDSNVTTLGIRAFRRTSINSLCGMERVREIGHACFAECIKLESMEGWSASLTVIPCAASTSAQT
jgi:hypothetical protein